MMVEMFLNPIRSKKEAFWNGLDYSPFKIIYVTNFQNKLCSTV